MHQRPIVPDPIFHSTLVTRFIKGLMRQGKRTVAEQIFYQAMTIIEQRTHRNPLEILEQAYRNVMPDVEVRSRRVGGSTYQVPTEVRPRRRVALTIRWIVGTARKRPEHSMEERLAQELMDAARGVGDSVKRREDTYRMAEANRAYAHYRF
jgi:small subunit ribosomal protein S7